MNDEPLDDEPELIADYIDEASDQMAQITSLIATLSIQHDNDQAWRDIFRLLHAVEGAAGMLGLATINELIHRLNSVLKRFQNGRQFGTADLASDAIPLIRLIDECHRKLSRGESIPHHEHLLNQLNDESN